MQQALIGRSEPSQATARRAVGPVAVAAIIVAGAFDAFGTYGDTSGNDPHQTRAFVAVLAIIAVAAAAVFGWIVPKLLERESLGTPALVFAALGLVSVLVFWSGLPPILAAGAGLLGWAGRDATRGAGRCRVALGLAGLALIADVVILVLDNANAL